MTDEICPCFSEKKEKCRIDNKRCPDKFGLCEVVGIMTEAIERVKNEVIEKKTMLAKYNGMKMFKVELDVVEGRLSVLESNFKD